MAGNINPNPFTTRPEIDGTFGVVASTHWIATAVGMGILERGGNAFDAACATAFALQVVEPHLNGPGGDVPVILYDVRKGKPEVICGQGPAPAGATIAHYKSEGLDMVPGTGLLAACVPGMFDSWMLLLRDYGTMRLADVLAPAIAYAQHGHPLVERANATIKTVEKLFRDHWPTSAAVYMPGGKPAETGKLFTNSALAGTYTRVLNEAESVGGDRIAQIEVAVADTATVLVLRNLDPLGAADREALARFETTHGVQIHLQPGGHDTIHPLGETATPLRYALPAHDLQFEFRATDFVQVNAATNARLVDLALESLQLGAEDRVLDLFCGLGNFSLPIARRARAVVGIEGEAGLVARARENAARNGIENAEFHVADLTQADGGAAALAGGFSRVLLDPPRTGAMEVLPRVAALAAARLVYVSCHPGTLARDLGVLCHQLGYRLEAAGVIDMFPHTNHVESIAVLERDR